MFSANLGITRINSDNLLPFTFSTNQPVRLSLPSCLTSVEWLFLFLEDTYSCPGFPTFCDILLLLCPYWTYYPWLAIISQPSQPLLNSLATQNSVPDLRLLSPSLLQTPPSPTFSVLSLHLLTSSASSAFLRVFSLFQCCISLSSSFLHLLESHPALFFHLPAAYIIFQCFLFLPFSLCLFLFTYWSFFQFFSVHLFF